MTHAYPHTPHHGTPHSHQRHDTGSHAEILDLDAEVLAQHTASITAWLPLKTSPRLIVDLGCGTGAGTFALLDRFPEAHVLAVDVSPDHLQRLRERACAQHAGERVRTVQADLDAANWPDLGTPDLVWASASMHHMADPIRALRNVHDMLAPGGLFAVVELADFPRFLPDNAPADRPGLIERVHAAADRVHAAHVPHRGADWGPMLSDVGFTVDGERTVAVNIEGSGNEAVGRYALGTLQRIRRGVAGELAAADLTALDRLLDADSPHSILRHDDLTVRTERTVWAAHRNA
ncbi:class I SAM-dependent methyltransferase [Streptomyces jietaisiensis]|uniref:class I SAM-dependent methyltransferase n=1 Tax=Streptomyces griseoaurantiacus TaxID=68213 RepID=UPI00324784C5